MAELSQIEKEKREFLNNCDLVIRVPLTWHLTEKSTNNWETVFPLRIYIYIGVIKGKGGIKVKARQYDSKANTFVDIESAQDFIMPMFYARLQHLSEKLKERNLSWLKTSEYRVWSEALYFNPFLAWKENLYTAFGFLIYVLMKKISQEELQEISRHWRLYVKIQSAKGIIDLVKEAKSDDKKRQGAIEMFRFCYPMPPSSGASALLSLFGAPDRYCGITYRTEPDEADLKNQVQINDNNFWEKGSIIVSMEDNAKFPFDLLLAYSEEKKDKFFGQALSPYLFDEVGKLNLTIITPKTGSLDLEKWEKRFTYDKGFLEFFAPTSVIRNVREELSHLERVRILYSSDTISFPWDTDGACLLEKKEYKLMETRKEVNDKSYARVWTVKISGDKMSESDVGKIIKEVQENDGLSIEKTGNFSKIFFREKEQPPPTNKYVFPIIEHTFKNHGVAGDIYELLSVTCNDKSVLQKLKELKEMRSKVKKLRFSTDDEAWRQAETATLDLEDKLSSLADNLRSDISRSVNLYLKPLKTKITAPMKGARSIRERAEYRLHPPISFVFVEY